MSHINVYVEEMIEHIPARLLPVTDMDKVREAMEHVQAVDDSYRNLDGTLKVDEAWHEAAVLDFGEWLITHLPSFTESIFCYNFGDFPVIRDWMRYNAFEMAQDLESAINEIFADNPPTPAELAQASTVSDILLHHDGALTLSAFGDISGIENVYIPHIAPEMDWADLSSLEIEEMEELKESGDEYVVYATELMMIALACLKSPASALAYTVHVDGDEGFHATGMFLFSMGHVVHIPQEFYPLLSELKTDNEEILAANLSAFMPRSNFEAVSARLAASIMLGMHASLNAAYECASKRSIDADIEKGAEGNTIRLALSDCADIVLSQNVLGEFAAANGPSLENYESLADFFDATLATSPFVTEKEATSFFVSALSADAACEILLTGTMDATSERIVDLFQELEFGLCDIDFDPMTAGVLEEHFEMLDAYRELDINDEVFENMPDEQKAEVNQLLAQIQLDAFSPCTVVSLEGDIEGGADDDDEYGGFGHSRKGSVKATAMRLPGLAMAGLHPQESAETERLLRQMCIQAFNSPSTTMFVSSRDALSDQVSLAAVKWSNGHWEDIGEDKAMFYLMASNIGDQLDILPGDDIDYRGYRS